MDAIHISTARRLMRLPEFSVDFLTAAGECRHVDKAVSLKEDLKSGTRTIKCIPSNQIRRIRDVLILSVNDIDVYL